MPESDAAPAPAATAPTEGETGPEPLTFEPSREALKDPKKMVEEYRRLVEEDLEEGGSVLLRREHAAAMAQYYRRMEAEVARAQAGQESAQQAEEHMAELTREELIEFWKKYAGIAFLCLVL
ncbi:hypothetical protein HZA43_05770 [Candidatus Peregrinibacteria bacterium]|nr:hypothetical protein [Candidatus Peregrinibacteria bacterium]